MKCNDRNGDISGYLVRYGVLGTTEEDRTVQRILGGDVKQVTISGLNTSTAYTIEVAAINNAAVSTGPYSDTLLVLTESRYNYMSFFCPSLAA